jgi:hypothetical protein
LRRRFPARYDVRTVEYMGWAEFENGDLIEAAASEGGSAFLTGDPNLHFQQNLTGCPFGVLTIKTTTSNEQAVFEKLLPDIIHALPHVAAGRDLCVFER